MRQRYEKVIVNEQITGQLNSFVVKKILLTIKSSTYDNIEFYVMMPINFYLEIL